MMDETTTSTTFDEICELSAALRSCWDVIHEKAPDMYETYVPHNMKNLSACIADLPIETTENKYCNSYVFTRDIMSDIKTGKKVTKFIVPYNATQMKKVLTDVNLSDVAEMQGNFSGYFRLSAIQLNSVEVQTGNSVFANLSSLQKLSMNKLGKCGSYFLQAAIGGSPRAPQTSLTEVSLNTLSATGVATFRYQNKLQHLSLPSLLNSSSAMCLSCTSLETAEFASLSALKGETAAFHSCVSLKTVSMPSLKIMSGNHFYRCTSLERVTLGAALARIAKFVSYSNKNVRFDITAKGSTLPTLDAWSSFQIPGGKTITVVCTPVQRALIYAEPHNKNRWYTAIDKGRITVEVA